MNLRLRSLICRGFASVEDVSFQGKYDPVGQNDPGQYGAFQEEGMSGP
jgi:hypothetical protein